MLTTNVENFLRLFMVLMSGPFLTLRALLFHGIQFGPQLMQILLDH